MFLIRYGESSFVDAEKIVRVIVRGSYVAFTTDGNKFSEVDKKLYEVFLNHLDCLNDNVDSTQSHHLKLKGEQK